MATLNYRELELIKLKEEEELRKKIPKLNVTKPFDKIFQKAVEMIFSDQMDSNSLRAGHINLNILNTCYLKIKRANIEELNKVKDFFIFLHKKKLHRLLEDIDLITAITHVADMSSFWIRDFSEWDKNSHNPNKQFSSLVRHLLCRYPVPEFLDSAWISGVSRDIDWFLHIGSGHSLKDIKTFPFDMTRKMSHYFLNAPNYLGIDEALRYAQVLGLGGDERLTNTICATRLRFHNDGFDASVVKFFAETPMLEHEQIGPIIDYVLHLKSEQTAKFSMKGRTIQSLSAGMEDWHEQLARLRAVENAERRRQGGNMWYRTEFKHCTWNTIGGIKNYSLIEKSNKVKNQYTITEILNSKELQGEGREMQHCVFSYASSCKDGNCSIWSLKINGERWVTIEVRNRQIVQVRGKRNSRPNEKLKHIITRWSKESGLKISNFAW